MEGTKIVIGAEVPVRFPKLLNQELIARVDTGAALSVIHCEQVFVSDQNLPLLTFYLKDLTDGKVRAFSTSEFQEKIIKNSFGEVEKRYVIRTQITLFGKKIRARFSLANRSRMNYPVLLGRKLLRQRFIVDVSI